MGKGFLMINNFRRIRYMGNMVRKGQYRVREVTNSHESKDITFSEGYFKTGNINIVCTIDI